MKPRRIARLIELAAALATIPGSIALYLWTILGDWYSFESCSSEGFCSTDHQSALEHEPFILALAAIPMVLALMVATLALIRPRQHFDARPIMYGLSASFIAFCFLTLFTIGALFAPLVPVIAVMCVAAACAGTSNLKPRT